MPRPNLNDVSTPEVAIITTAVVLKKEEESEIIQILSEKLKKNVKMNNNVDKALIAGMYIQIGDRVFDTTLKTKLEQLRDRLLQ